MGSCGIFRKRQTDHQKPSTRLCPFLILWPRLQTGTPCGRIQGELHLESWQRQACSGGQDNRNLRTQMLGPMSPGTAQHKTKGSSDKILVQFLIRSPPAIPGSQCALACVIAGATLEAADSPQPLGPRGSLSVHPSPRGSAPAVPAKPLFWGGISGAGQGGVASPRLCCGCLHTCN